MSKTCDLADNVIAMSVGQKYELLSLFFSSLSQKFAVKPQAFKMPRRGLCEVIGIYCGFVDKWDIEILV